MAKIQVDTVASGILLVLVLQLWCYCYCYIFYLLVKHLPHPISLYKCLSNIPFQSISQGEIEIEAIAYSLSVYVSFQVKKYAPPICMGNYTKLSPSQNDKNAENITKISMAAGELFQSFFSLIMVTVLHTLGFVALS